MKTLIRLSSLIHALITILFVGAALVLIVTSVNVGFQALLKDSKLQ